MATSNSKIVLPAGGTTGQVLSKNSNGDYDIEWSDASGGVTDHGALTGLSDDDHPQYHTDARGDARYYTKGQVDTAIGVVQTDIDVHEANTSNPHSVTKSQVGLGSVDNTSDLDKPVSTAQQAAIDAKVSDVTYDATSWNGVTTVAPSKNAVRDKIESMVAAIAQKADLVSYSQYGGF